MKNKIAVSLFLVGFFANVGVGFEAAPTAKNNKDCLEILANGFYGDPLDGIFNIIHPSIGRIKIVQFLPNGHLVKNKPDYEKFNWEVWESKHIKLWTYSNSPVVLKDYYVDKIESAYDRLLLRFNTENFGWKIRWVNFNSRRGFEENKLLPGFVPDGLGGSTQTEYTKTMTLYFNGSKSFFEHVLAHELAHEFQIQTLGKGLRNVPLWFIEGSAEHFSEKWGADGETLMRDAYLNGFLAPISEAGKFRGSVPILYKESQFISNYIYEQYKKDGYDPVVDLFKKSSYQIFDKSFEEVTGLNLKEFDNELFASLEKRYQGLRVKRDLTDYSKLVNNPEKGSQVILGSDGEKSIFLSIRPLFQRHLLEINYWDGLKVVSKKIKEDGYVGVNRLRTSGADIRGNKFVYVTDIGPADALVVQDYKLADKKNLFGKEKKKFYLGKEKRYFWKNIREIYNPVFAGEDQIAFIGMEDNFTNIYIYDISKDQLISLTGKLGQNFYSGLTYSSKFNVLVSAVESSSLDGDYNMDLMEFNLSSHTAKVLFKTEDNESSPQFSKNGEKLLYVSDSGLVYNLYLLDYSASSVKKLTDARIGIFRGKWLNDKTIAFNSLNEMQFNLHIARLPGSVDLKNEELNSSVSSQKGLDDSCLKSQATDYADLTIFDRVVSTETKQSLWVANRELSFEEVPKASKLKKSYLWLTRQKSAREELGKKTSPIRFYFCNKSKLYSFTLSEFDSLKDYLGGQILSENKILFAKKKFNMHGTGATLFLYDVLHGKLDKIKPDVEFNPSNGWKSFGVISRNGRYLLINNDKKILVYDAQNRSMLLKFKSQLVDSPQFISETEIGYFERKNHFWQNRDLVFKVIDLKTLKFEEWVNVPRGGIIKSDDELSWQISKDKKKFLLEVFPDKEIDGIKLLVLNRQSRTFSVAADKLAEIISVDVSTGGFSVKAVNGFKEEIGLEIASGVQESVSVKRGRYPKVSQLEIVQLAPELMPSVSFKSDVIYKQKQSSLSKIPNNYSGMAGGSVATSGHSVVTAIFLSMAAMDDIGEREFGVSVAQINFQYGLGEGVFIDHRRRYALAVNYLDFGQESWATVSAIKNIYLGRFYNWDLTLSQQAGRSNSNDEVLGKRFSKTSIGSTFSLNTVAYEWQGPHSGNAFFTGTEAGFNAGEMKNFDLNLEAKKYFPITERSGLANRVEAGKSFGNEPTLFLVGGNKTFRGTPLFSLRGNNYAFVSSELRLPLADLVLVKVPDPVWSATWPFLVYPDIRFGPYIDVGDVWYNRGQLISGDDDFGHYRPKLVYSGGYFINIPTVFGLILRYNQGTVGDFRGWNFWIGYNW